MEKSNKFLIFGLILGASLIITGAIIARTFLDIKNLDNILTVSGSAKITVTADSAVWTGNFSRVIFKDQIKDGYAQMKNDEKIVSDFLTSQGFKDVEISPVFMNEIYKNNPNDPQQYNLIQNIKVKSPEVEKMKELAKNSDKLATQGVIFSVNPVEYYYSKLPELRISLLPEAIKDAKNRAKIIAESSGKQVDTIKSVSMGVVQVMQVDSIDVSDYGSYDTSTINKDVMVTVKAVFGLK